MSNEITIQKNYSIAEIETMGNIMMRSGFYGYKKPEEAMALMLQAQADGIHPAMAVQQYHVINGRPTLKSQAMQARFQAAGGKTKWIKRSATECSIHVSHPEGGELDVTWTIDRAKKAGLLNNPTWNKYPEAMLSARCISEAVRYVYPLCLGGLYTPEEAEDMAFESEQKKELTANGYTEVRNDPAPNVAPKEKKALTAEEKTANFEKVMGNIRAKNEALFDKGYDEKYNCWPTYKDVPAEKRTEVATYMRDYIANPPVVETVETESAEPELEL